MRLAEVIDSSRQGLVSSFTLKRFGRKVTCVVETQSGDDACQEVAAVSKLNKDLASAFGLEFNLTVY